MVDLDKLQEMDGIIIELGLAIENARYTAQDVVEEYFSLRDKRDRERCFNRGCVKNRIAYDYILEAEKLAERLTPIFEALFNEIMEEKHSGEEKADIPFSKEEV